MSIRPKSSYNQGECNITNILRNNLVVIKIIYQQSSFLDLKYRSLTYQLNAGSLKSAVIDVYEETNQNNTREFHFHHADKWLTIFLLPKKTFSSRGKMSDYFSEEENNLNWSRYKAHFTYKVPHVLRATALFWGISPSPL